MVKAGVLCPHCKGTVHRSWKGQALEDALDRHIHLSHTVVKLKPNPAPDPFADLPTPKPKTRKKAAPQPEPAPPKKRLVKRRPAASGTRKGST